MSAELTELTEITEFADIQAEIKALLGEFTAAATEQLHHQPGRLWVIGCSTSEILGGRIGKAGSAALGELLAREVIAAAEAAGLIPLAQCCEHLNRSLVCELEVAERLGLNIVSAVPKPHAGGSFAAAFYKQLAHPVLVEAASAHCGLDIGQTLIGMHLKRVAVPLRLSTNHLGGAIITAAYTRPPLIGGERAQYV